ncbi:ribonuclease HII [Paracoccus aminophilus]|uniref:Ribonuclease HII n=1 Tax=Paracoccus aminophilus JCM 7686 TaxID=1367847 RepID=S5YY59_PARAH|nr:ribonuclease HII [Paracoccus aminophilus]AGT10116.1 ribonuclease HII [Paracoccus aminophilus JCM 7686]
MSQPDLEFELAAQAQGARLIAGVDEVGRGPLAGPVTAAAVILCEDPPAGLNDSKKLSAKRRDALAEEIMARCDWAYAHVWIDEIDRLNIYHASHLAMCRAVEKLKSRPDLALIDGNAVPRDLAIPAQAIVKGDARSLSIAAASIVAKVLRDRLMVDLAQQHPGYGWERNAGYPTKVHLEALLNLGVTPYHRRSFAPVHNILCKGLSTTD